MQTKKILPYTFDTQYVKELIAEENLTKEDAIRALENACTLIDLLRENLRSVVLVLKQIKESPYIWDNRKD